MKKTVLSIDYDYDYYIVGISCHLKDYRITYWLNKELNLNFIKQENFRVSGDEESPGFSYYYDCSQSEETVYYLLANRSESGLLLPECKECDYIFIVENLFDHQHDGTVIFNAIKNLKSVLTAFEIDYDHLKHKDRLIFN